MTTMLRLVPRTDRFLSLMPEIDIVGRLFDDLELPELFSKEEMLVPDFDLAETEKEYTITGEIPGIDAKDLKVTLADGVLTVKGEKKQEKEDNGEYYHRVERGYGCFARSFRLPDDVRAEESKAMYKDGVLKLTLPKGEERTVKKIEVKESKPRNKGKSQQKAE